MAETAQATFARLLRDEAAPALRAAGLRGSGNNYVLPDDEWWAQINFQKSNFSTSEVVKFKVTLGAVRKAHWDEIRREHSYVRDTPPAAVSKAEWDATRLTESYIPQKPPGGGIITIGHLMPEIRADRLWSLSPEDPEHTMPEVVEAVKLYGIPALHNRIRTGVWDNALPHSLRVL